jgi:hypothetical protein
MSKVRRYSLVGVEVCWGEVILFVRLLDFIEGAMRLI